jgi:uncharacterized membrane protein YbhN (UPF0104 family)
MLKSKFVRRLIQILFILVLAYFMAPVFADSVRAFDPADWKINYWWLAASLLLMQVVLFAQSTIWSTIVAMFGKKVGWLKAFKIAYLGQLGRYLPGRIWQLFAVVYLASKEGIRKEEATATFILSQLFATPPGLLIIIVYLFASGYSAKYAAYAPVAWVSAACLLVSLAIILRPSWFERSLNLALKIIRQPAVEFHAEKKMGLAVLFFYFVTWNLYGVCFYLFLLSILPGLSLSMIEIVGAWTLAYLIGYWAIVLPAGIGAREAALIVLLAPSLGPERAGIVVIGARLWSMLGEVICTILAWRVK